MALQEVGWAAPNRDPYYGDCVASTPYVFTFSESTLCCAATVKISRTLIEFSRLRCPVNAWENPQNWIPAQKIAQNLIFENTFTWSIIKFWHTEMADGVQGSILYAVAFLEYQIRSRPPKIRSRPKNHQNWVPTQKIPPNLIFENQFTWSIIKFWHTEMADGVQGSILHAVSFLEYQIRSWPQN